MTRTNDSDQNPWTYVLFDFLTPDFWNRTMILHDPTKQKFFTLSSDHTKGEVRKAGMLEQCILYFLTMRSKNGANPSRTKHQNVF